MYFKITPRKYTKQSIRLNYGISHCTANKIMGIFKLHPNAPFKQLRSKRFQYYVDSTFPKLRIGFRLRLIVFSRMCLLISIDSYRGLRMLQGLPTRGQRTHANGKTPKALHKQLKFFPFLLLFKKRRLTSKKQDRRYGKKDSLLNKNKKSIVIKKKVSSKQKAKIKAKNKAKAKAKKKANKK
jgi:small subunit ribosomal protein S13